MTVATTATAHLEDVQSREVLGLWDGIASLVRDLEQNALHSRHGISVLGIDLSCREGRKHHQRIMSVLKLPPPLAALAASSGSADAAPVASSGASAIGS